MTVWYDALWARTGKRRAAGSELGPKAMWEVCLGKEIEAQTWVSLSPGVALILPARTSVAVCDACSGAGSRRGAALDWSTGKRGA